MNLHFFVLLAQLSFSSQPFRIFSLIFHSLLYLQRREDYCVYFPVGHAKALGSSYDVMSAMGRPKRWRKLNVLFRSWFSSLSWSRCVLTAAESFAVFLHWIFLDRDLKYCVLLIREMGKMQAIWEFFTSKELKIGKIFVSLTIQCGRQFQRILIKR